MVHHFWLCKIFTWPTSMCLTKLSKEKAKVSDQNLALANVMSHQHFMQDFSLGYCKNSACLKWSIPLAWWWSSAYQKLTSKQQSYFWNFTLFFHLHSHHVLNTITLHSYPLSSFSLWAPHCMHWQAFSCVHWTHWRAVHCVHCRSLSKYNVNSRKT